MGNQQGTEACLGRTDLDSSQNAPDAPVCPAVAAVGPAEGAKVETDFAHRYILTYIVYNPATGISMIII